jgi:chromosome segregation ATPase
VGRPSVTPARGYRQGMPEPGDLVTSTRVFGIDSVIQQLGALTAALDNLRREVLDRMTSLEGQFGSLRDALTNIANDVAGLKSQLDAALADVQGQIDAAKAQQLQDISNQFQPIVDQAQSLADATPDAPPAPPEPTP